VCIVCFLSNNGRNRSITSVVGGYPYVGVGYRQALLFRCLLKSLTYVVGGYPYVDVGYRQALLGGRLGQRKMLG